MTDNMHSIDQNRFSRTMSRTFLSLRNRNFRLFFIGQMISNTGNWLTNVALTLLILKLTGSGLAVGAVAACQYGPILFFSAWGGAIADRVNKRRMLLVTQTLEMTQSIGLAILAFQPHPSVAGLFVLAMIGGTLLAFDNPLRRSLVGEMVPASDIPNAVVLYTIIINVSRVLGPALAGILSVTLGFGWCFTIDAASYVAVITGILLMRPADMHVRPHEPQTKGNVREGLRYIMSIPSLWISFATLAAIGTFAFNFDVTLPLLVTRTLQSSTSVYALIYATYGLGSVVCGLIVAHREVIKLRHVLVSAAVLGITMLLLASVSRIAIAVPVVFLIGMASILYKTSAATIAQVDAKPAMHGRVLALQTVCTAGTSLIGGPLCGYLADTLGARMPIIVGGMVCLGAAGFGFGAMRGFVGEKLPPSTQC